MLVEQNQWQSNQTIKVILIIIVKSPICKRIPTRAKEQIKREEELTHQYCYLIPV
jgi:hypothetical protein